MNHHDRSSYRIGRRAATTLGLATIIVGLLVSGCGFTLGLGAPDPEELDAQLRVWPELRCPGEAVNIAWNGGGQYPDCAPSTPGSCKSNDLQIFSNIYYDLPLSGTRREEPSNSTIEVFVKYRLYSHVNADGERQVDEVEKSSRSWLEAYANPDREPEQTIAVNYEMQCDPASRTWVLRQKSITPRSAGPSPYPGDYEFDMAEFSPCLGVTRVCTNRAAATIRADGAPGEASTTAALGSSAATFSCSMDDFDGYSLGDLDVEFTDPDWPQAGQPCTPGETVPSGDLLPYTLLIGLGCMTPDQMQGAGLGALGSTADLCRNNWLEPSASEPIISEPGVEPGEDLPTICNLAETCGDGVCDQPCEDAQFCAADCLPEGTTPTPTVPPQDVCADQGGLQWQGEICDCTGVVDNVTLCKNGTKVDDVTDVSCTPDPKDCPNDGGGSDTGGGSQCKCGNGQCEASCGENSNTCLADCP